MPPKGALAGQLNRHILLIDDDRDMAEMLAEYLGPEGYTVDLAYTAGTGLQRIKEGGLTLIIRHQGRSPYRRPMLDV